MKVLAVSISAQKGVKKINQPQIKVLLEQGVENDAHIGAEPLRQVSLLAQESIDIMKNQGLPGLLPGDFAENITTEGLELHTLPLGTRLRLGPEAVLVVSQIGKTCHHGCAIKQTAGSCIMPTHGIFGRVETPGLIRPGDSIAVERA
jgi:MOSC domain-containing protein YiiM